MKSVMFDTIKKPRAATPVAPRVLHAKVTR